MSGDPNLRNPMRRSLLFTAPLLFASFAAAQSTQPTTQTSAAFAQLAQFAGTWTIDAKWAAKGDSFKGRQLVEPLLNGAFVSVRTWSSTAGAAESQRDITIYGQQDGQLVQWVYTPDGQVRQTTASPTDDGSILFEWTKIDGKGKPLQLRQVINPVDANTYRWRTLMFKGGEWHTLIDGQWKRG
jgi:hypothetical protein